MASKELFVGIGIIIGLAVGLGVGFGFSATSESENDSKVLDVQSFQQMMLDDSSAMQEMILSTMQDSDQMQMMEDMMKEMMIRMQDDPELKQTMMEHMDRMKASKEAMMGTDDQMMNDMMEDSTMAFNLAVPITIPMIDGYYNGEKVFFIHTEFSTSDMANMATMMINFPTLYASELQEIPSEETGKIYAFTNGIPGSGPYGGGPFFFQIDIFDSIPGQGEYSQFRAIHLVTWDDGSTPRILTSLDELLQAQTNGEVSIERTDLVVNAPMIVWMSDGTEQTASVIQNMFESMGNVEGEVVNVDVDNYIATFKLKSDKQMNMMN